ncbi:MAG: DUF4124 domain-containing protein [Pseudomonadota bacterium]
MDKTKFLGSALILAALFGNSAEAKLYKWIDEKGETHYGEVVPPEYANRDRVQIDQGRQIKKTEPREVPDPALSKKNADERAAAAEQSRKDRALVNTYSNEQEIDLARDRNLQQVQTRIESVQLLLKSAQNNLANYYREAEGLKKAGKNAPDSLQTDIRDAENAVAKLKNDLAKAQQKDLAVKTSFENDKARYRELVNSAKQ